MGSGVVWRKHIPQSVIPEGIFPAIGGSCALRRQQRLGRRIYHLASSLHAIWFTRRPSRKTSSGLHICQISLADTGILPSSKLFSVVKSNYERIHNTISANLERMIQARNWSGAGGSGGGSLDGIVVFEVLTTFYSECVLTDFQSHAPADGVIAGFSPASGMSSGRTHKSSPSSRTSLHGSSSGATASTGAPSSTRSPRVRPKSDLLHLRISAKT